MTINQRHILITKRTAENSSYIDFSGQDDFSVEELVQINNILGQVVNHYMSERITLNNELKGLEIYARQ